MTNEKASAMIRRKVKSKTGRRRRISINNACGLWLKKWSIIKLGPSSTGNVSRRKWHADNFFGRLEKNDEGAGSLSWLV